jgi:hypothetical protein
MPWAIAAAGSTGVAEVKDIGRRWPTALATAIGARRGLDRHDKEQPEVNEEEPNENPQAKPSVMPRTRA